MKDKIFVDTNVLVYSRDISEPEKQKLASGWMAHLWKTRRGRLSYQVLQEFYVTVTERLKPGLPPSTARSDVRSLWTWDPVPIDDQIIDGAWLLQDRYRLSWWDSLIVSAAQAAECRYLLTEDLQDAQDLGKVRIVNPFGAPPESILDK